MPLGVSIKHEFASTQTFIFACFPPLSIISNTFPIRFLKSSSSLMSNFFSSFLCFLALLYLPFLDSSAMSYGEPLLESIWERKGNRLRFEAPVAMYTCAFSNIPSSGANPCVACLGSVFGTWRFFLFKGPLGYENEGKPRLVEHLSFLPKCYCNLVNLFPPEVMRVRTSYGGKKLTRLIFQEEMLVRPVFLPKC